MVKQITSDAEFTAELDKSAGKLLVADFFATWCGPCRQIAPFYEQLGAKFPQVNFIKVDVDICQATAASQNVTAMPTFLLFLNRKKVEAIKGADPAVLEEKVRHWAAAVTTEEGDGEASGVPPGQLDLTSFLMAADCECLNESDGHMLGDCLTAAPQTYLESDCDAQLIFRLVFNQAVKIHSVRFKSESDGPKTVKMFINLPQILDFDKATTAEATQLLELTAKQVADGETIPLRYVKFQNVQNLQVFVVDNQSGAETTRIGRLQLFGSPIQTTNMGDFKRVAGKKGEGH